MKIKLLSILSLFVACSPNYKHLSSLHQFETPRRLERKVASQGGACFIDQFDISQIKAEISILEKNWNTRAEIPKEFEFSTFKNAETHYINLFNTYITLNDLGIQCDNLPCLLNSAYGQTDGEEGYRIYHWFLTMGSGISTKNLIPNYKTDDTRALKDYLFPNQELKILNMVSKMISHKYRKNLVSTIHRFPDGTAPDLMVAGRYNPTWTMWTQDGRVTNIVKNPSVIFLTKQSIILNPNEKLIKGNYLPTVLHELSHALDFTFGKENSEKSFSEEEAWTTLSWKWAEISSEGLEVIDGKEELVEKTIMGWIPDDLKSDGFATDYARVSPAEDFAETGASYILDPKFLNENAFNKYSLFRDTYYHSKGKSKDHFIENYSTQITTLLLEDLWETVKNCLIDNETIEVDQTIFQLEDFQYLPVQERRCLEISLQNQINNELFYIKKSDYHACHYLKSSDTDIYAAVALGIKDSLSDYIEKLGDYKNVQEIWKSFREELKNNCDTTHIFLDARYQENAQEYYQAKLIKCVENIHARFSNFSDLFLEEKYSYLRTHTYQAVEEKTIFAYNQLMNGFSTNLLIGAEQLIESCQIKDDNELFQLQGPVFGAAIYVNSGLLNCINDKFSKTLDRLLHEFLLDDYNMSESSLRYLTERYSTSFVDYINRKLFDIHSIEKSVFEMVFIEERKDTFVTLFQDNTILKEFYHSDDSETFCKMQIKKQVSEIIAHKWLTQGWPKTHSLNEVSNDVIDQLCPELFNEAKNKYQAEFDKIKESVESFVFESTKGPHDWLKSLEHEEDFRVQCHQKEDTTALDFVNKLLESKNYNFLNANGLKNDVVLALCESIHALLVKQTEDIKKESHLHTSYIIKLLKEDLTWQSVFNKEDYIKNCHNQSQLKLDSDFLGTNDFFTQYHLLSPGLISKHLGDKACQLMLNDWESKDLEILRSILFSGKDANHGILGSSHEKVWQNYMNVFYFDIILDLFKQEKIRYDNFVEGCKNKFPYVRFATMKLNRRQCLESFFTNLDPKRIYEAYAIQKNIHPDIANLIKEAYSIEIKKLQNDIENLLKE